MRLPRPAPGRNRIEFIFPVPRDLRRVPPCSLDARRPLQTWRYRQSSALPDHMLRLPWHASSQANGAGAACSATQRDALLPVPYASARPSAMRDQLVSSYQRIKRNEGNTYAAWIRGL